MFTSTPESEPTTRAPAVRATSAALARAVAYFHEHPEEFAVLDAVPEPVFVLNGQRQVVYANSAADKLAETGGRESLFAQRPGELLGCEHATETPGGCGTTEHCTVCGALHAALDGLAGTRSVQECHLNQAGMRASFDLRVWGTPLQVGGEDYCIFAVRDIADEKRRQALEEAFFHDILNTAGGLLGFVELMQFSTAEELQDLDLMATLPRLASQLIEEINCQRFLSRAEFDEVACRVESLDPVEQLERVAQSLRAHPVAAGRTIVVEPETSPARLCSDGALVRRVLGNMLKNALEASAKGEAVSLACIATDAGIEYRVHNPAVMPLAVQLQVFQRSFSTKGKGRGVGTFSMKLLTERYLGGVVGFESQPDTGTTFWVRLPFDCKVARAASA